MAAVTLAVKSPLASGDFRYESFQGGLRVSSSKQGCTKSQVVSLEIFSQTPQQRGCQMLLGAGPPLSSSSVLFYLCCTVSSHFGV